MQQINWPTLQIQSGELETRNAGQLITKQYFNPRCALVIEGRWRYSQETDDYKGISASCSDFIKVQTRVDTSSSRVGSALTASVLSDVDFSTGISTRLSTHFYIDEMTYPFAIDINGFNVVSNTTPNISITPNSTLYFKIRDLRNKIEVYYEDLVLGGNFFTKKDITIISSTSPYQIAFFNRYRIYTTSEPASLPTKSWFDDIVISTAYDPIFTNSAGFNFSVSNTSPTVTLALSSIMYNDSPSPRVEIDWGDNTTTNVTMNTQKAQNVFSTNQAPSHTYDTYGNYTISVRIRDTNCDIFSDWISREVELRVSTSTSTTSAVAPPLTTSIVSELSESSSSPTSKRDQVQLSIAIGATSSAIVVLAVALILFLVIRRAMNKAHQEEEELPKIEEEGTANVIPKELSLKSQQVYSKVSYRGTVIPLSKIKLLEVLGKGSFGIVRKGLWKNQLVALKEVAEETLSEKAVEEMMEEAKVMETIPTHPNVLRMIGLTNFPHEQFMIVTEFCSRGSLLDYIRSEDTISNEFVKKTLIGIAKGLAHIHKCGLVHRDIAARNILLTEELLPKISDFGMTRKLKDNASHHSTATGIGPIKWMAPESIEKRIFSFKTDVWSFGVVIGELTTKTVPLAHLSNLECVEFLVYRKEEVPIPPIIEENLANLMKLCFQKEPNNRPTCEDIIVALSNFF